MNKWINQKTIRVILLLGTILLIGNLLNLFLQSIAEWEKIDAQKSALSKLGDSDKWLNWQEQQLLKLDQLSVQQAGSQHIKIRDALDMGHYLEQTAHKVHVTLLTLPQVRKQVVNGYQVMEGSFQIRAGYQDIIRFVFSLEQVDRACAISYLDLALKRYRTNGKRKEDLVATIGFRMVIP